MCVDEPMPINKLRAEAENIETFDASLENLINLYTKLPEIDYPDGKLLYHNKLTTINGGYREIYFFSELSLEALSKHVYNSKRHLLLCSNLQSLSSTFTRRTLRR